MTRLSRPQSQARTRAAILATARDLYLTNGFGETSLEKVAEVAGFSKGAVYSNFRNKNQLCLEVLELIHATKFGEVAELLQHNETLEARFDAFELWAERTLGDVGWTMLEFEFIVRTRNEPELRTALTDNLAALHNAMGEVLAALATQFEVSLPLPATDMARSLLSLGIGLGIQRAIDPSISARVLADTLRAALRIPTNPPAEASTPRGGAAG